ncbi:MAG: ParB N-terminal domain-containing protein [Nitrospirae bacterium]|nr:ParB N-terminal domain-containing protein [Nitrospirota bacterium]
MDEHAKIVLMAKRIHEMIPLDKIVVLNSRTRDAQKFEEIVRSIEAVGLLQPIKVNRRNLETKQCYELICGEGRCLACKKLGHTVIQAEVVDCDEESAFIESLVENMARLKPGTMAFARELKRMYDDGVSIEKIAGIACRHPSYVRSFIQLVEQGEDRLIKGVEQGLFSITFALQVAQSDHVQVQHVLMDAYDSGVVNGNNLANVKKIIELRLSSHGKNSDRRNETAAHIPNYTVHELTKDITRITKEKEGFVREATAKENRLFTMLLALKTLSEDEQWRNLVTQAGISGPPSLESNLNCGAAANTGRNEP